MVATGLVIGRAILSRLTIFEILALNRQEDWLFAYNGQGIYDI